MIVTINLKQIPNQPPEIYYGNKEYKITLDYKEKSDTYITKMLQKKASQMLFRLNEGNGKAIYLIGVEDNGNAKGINILNLLKSINHIKKISKIIQCTISKINIYKGSQGFISSIRLVKNIENRLLI